MGIGMDGPWIFLWPNMDGKAANHGLLSLGNKLKLANS